MDSLPSSEFRKRFARLTARTEVTVNGHPIGTWLPAGAASSGEPDGRSNASPADVPGRVREPATTRQAASRSPEFRPAPKPLPRGR